MGKRAQEIINIDKLKLIEMLNKAFADEWLAYYQYWLGAKVATGPMRTLVVTELVEHANEELQHADLLVERIIQLGGTPILNPKEWYIMANCAYTQPSDPFIKTLLEQNIEGERCAIDVYQTILNKTKDKDHVTYSLALQILEDEIKHKEDLENLLEDFNRINIK